MKEYVDIKRLTRFDSEFTQVLSKCIYKEYNLKEYALYTINTSLFNSGKKYIMLEKKVINSKFKYYKSVIKWPSMLENIINFVSTNRSYEEIIQFIMEKGEYMQEEANSFADNLISEEILIHDFNLNITGIEYFDYVISRLKIIHNNYIERDKQKIEDLIDFLELINKELKIGTTIENYIELKYLIKNKFPQIASKNIFHVDSCINMNDVTI